MRKIKALLVMGVAAMTIASCSNDMELKSASQGTTPIQLSTYIGNQSTTRVVANAAYSGSGNYTFDLQDNQFLSSIGNSFNGGAMTDNNIGVYFKDNATENPIQYANAYKYRCRANGGLEGPEVYYPTSGSTIDIYAVYPNNDYVGDVNQSFQTIAANYYGNGGLPSSIPTALNFTVQTDQTSHINYCSSDFMYAKLASQSANGSAVTLQFNHMLSKIRVNLNVTDATLKSRLNNAKLQLTNVMKTTTLNVTDGVIASPTYDVSNTFNRHWFLRRDDAGTFLLFFEEIVRIALLRLGIPFLENENKSKFILHFACLFVSLQAINYLLNGSYNEENCIYSCGAIPYSFDGCGKDGTLARRFANPCLVQRYDAGGCLWTETLCGDRLWRGSLCRRGADERASGSYRPLCCRGRWCCRDPSRHVPQRLALLQAQDTLADRGGR